MAVSKGLEEETPLVARTLLYLAAVCNLEVYFHLYEFSFFSKSKASASSRATSCITEALAAPPFTPPQTQKICRASKRQKFAFVSYRVVKLLVAHRGCG